MAKHKKRNFVNANPPRSCRAVPAVLEDNSKKILASLSEVYGKRGKLREADINYDFTGKNPKISLSTRFFRKHTKRTEFPIDPNQLSAALVTA